MFVDRGRDGGRIRRELNNIFFVKGSSGRERTASGAPSGVTVAPFIAVAVVNQATLGFSFVIFNFAYTPQPLGYPSTITAPTPASAGSYLFFERL